MYNKVVFIYVTPISTYTSTTFRQLIELSKAMRLFNISLVHKHKLTPNQFYVMEICEHISNASIKKIKEELLLSSQSLSRIIWKLYDKWIIERSFEPNKDKRVVIISLTKLWIEMFYEITQSALSKLEANQGNEDNTVWVTKECVSIIKELFDKENIPTV